ncbi:peptidoglycan D,D-transpeptidase FtsI family protein [Nocardioides speluncae]|uniref:peptidoglycan D,D-transpeptidase FtsI family protein n=1 Tax=Nocardioides speluncae TaxID=2670337 RepID=UPI000D694F94|nr:penicillin-binding protein 2 [Nocardioides speluncae]
MNKPIRTMSIFCMLLFLALLANSTYVMYLQSGELADDPNNRRIVEARFSRERGAILVGKNTIAESKPSDDRYLYQRVYSTPFKYAHLTGVFNFFGQTALEKTQNDFLSGDDDSLFLTSFLDMISSKSPKGGSVQLTIDPRAQDAAWDGLNEDLPAGTRASAVALEPSTGKILAMASIPSYDPNKLASHDLDEVNKQDRRLQKDDNKPLDNRAIETRLPPGSTFKLVTAAAALESGDYDSAEDLVPGGFEFDLPQTDDTIGNHDGGDCGGERITMSSAMQQSCNVSFLSLANDLGPEKMREQAEAFGFNQEYLDDLPGQVESAYPANLDPPQTAMSGIGQSEVAATPLQMAMVVAAIANDGVVMKPYLVDNELTPDLEALPKTEPEDFSEAVSPSTAEELTKMMVATVDDGTGEPAQIDGVEVAGKTGTAQSAAERNPYAWFVAFAPDHDVAVAVMIQDAAGVGRDEIAGGRLGGPIAKSIIEAVIE